MTDAEGQMWLEDRKMKIQSVIEEYGEDRFYISYSGGKDSTVLHNLIDEALPGNKIPRVYANTGIEYVEMVKWVKSRADKDKRFVILSPKINIQQMLKENGYPFKSKQHSAYHERFRRSGLTPGLERYVWHTGKMSGSKHACPKVLRYQFLDPEFNLHISDKCCTMLKERPLEEYATKKCPLKGGAE